MVQAPPKPDETTRPSEAALAVAPVVVRFPADLLTDDLLLEISNLNDPWRFERNAEGALEISLPNGSLGAIRSQHIAGQLYAWWTASEDGAIFDSSAGFRLASGSVRSPDASWASTSLIEHIQPDDEGFWPICPEFVVEVRSPSQKVQWQQEKMEEWMAAGARLGWLIDVYTGAGEAWVYRAGAAEPERLERPDSLSGEDIAEGLSVDLTRVWR